MSAKRVWQLVREAQHQEAERLLSALITENPADLELIAELGLLYCFTQREFEAVDLLERAGAGERANELRQLLANYFECRRQMAAKLKTDDPKGAAMIRRVGGIPDANASIKLSACLIVKDEEANLDRCLKSLEGVVDEIVVVDTGSTDRTVEIAVRHGAVLGHFAWCDDFAAARNASLELATGNWALWIDADEELTAESRNSIYEAVIRPHFGGYFIRIVNLMDADNEANQYVHKPVRLFRRIPEIRFDGRIHEQVLQAFDQHGLIAATLGNATLKHYGYQQAVMQQKDKLNRTVTMLEREVKEHPRDPFHWFNLANAYSVGRRSADAERAARVCVNFLPQEAPYAPVAYQILTSALIAQDRSDEALLECELAEIKGFYSVINEFDRAHALLKLDRLEEALQSIDRCLTMDWPSDLTGDYAIKTYKGLVLKSQILTRLGHPEQGLELAQRALQVDPSFPIGLYAQGMALEKLDRPREAAESYLEASYAPGMEPCARLAAKQFMAAGVPDEAAQILDRLFDDFPKDADLASMLLHALEAIGDDARLQAAYAKVASSGMATAPLLVNWGRSFARVGDLDNALASFAAAAEVDPTYANAFLNAGDVLYANGRFGEAGEWYEQALRLDPTNSQAWFVLGNCFARMGHTEGAELAYGQTLAFDPHHREARANLEVVLAA